MRVGVGYSDNPNTRMAGHLAATQALEQAGRGSPDLALLFSTARHDGGALYAAVHSILGENVPIYGGGAVGAICNGQYGYAGDQVIIAAIWLEGVSCDVLVEPGLRDGEFAVGERLGRRLAAMGLEDDSPLLMFYDAIDRSMGGMRMLMATPLLAGIESGLGFLPGIIGAGLQGDYLCTPARQWIGSGTGAHHVLALKFGGNIRMDSIIMHGCRPATGYYTVTKADHQTILEINGKPAIAFLESLLGNGMKADDFPFFLILGVNQGDEWGEYDENAYASRLCLDVDKERGGLVMFEPDMIEGTKFQIMYRSLDLDYMMPKLDELFARVKDRKLVFATYINCAGRAGGYGGEELEDAIVIQKATAGKVPLMGLYTGVEIAPVNGRSRGLDWTGVFTLFSEPGTN